MAVGIPQGLGPPCPGDLPSFTKPSYAPPGVFEGAVKKSVCLSLTLPLPRLPVASTFASAGPPSILPAACSFTVSLCRLEKGGDFQATRMEALALGQPRFLAHHPLPTRPHPGLPLLYGRQSANSQRREVGQSLRPRAERLFTASGSSWLQRSGGLASR